MVEERENIYYKFWEIKKLTPKFFRCFDAGARVSYKIDKGGFTYLLVLKSDQFIHKRVFYSWVGQAALTECLKFQQIINLGNLLAV